MNKLVFIENGRPITDSLIVAETFGKRHDNVLRDIKELECSEQFSLLNFEETPYMHPQNGQVYEKYLITQDGFAFLAFGYTGKEAARFKEMYINEFNQMKEHLNNNSYLGMSPELQAILMLDRKTQAVEDRVDIVERKVEEQITLDHGEARRLQRAISTRVYKHSETDEQRKQLFSELHREIKDRWGIPSYQDVKRKDFTDVLGYVEAWFPRKKAGNS